MVLAETPAFPVWRQILAVFCGVARNFYFEGYSPQELWGTEVPMAPGTKPRSGSLRIPQKLKQFADIVYSFDCRNDQKLKISHNNLLPDP